MFYLPWISVADMLPDENTPVLVYFEDRGTTMLTHFYKDFALIQYGPKGFEKHGVTHWCVVTPPR